MEPRAGSAHTAAERRKPRRRSAGGTTDVDPNSSRWVWPGRLLARRRADDRIEYTPGSHDSHPATLNFPYLQRVVYHATALFTTNA
jgi:hypothetical protein